MLNEYDINDFKKDFDSYVPTGEETKLYNVQRYTVISTPVGKVYFERLDGLYSLCFSQLGEFIHLNANTPVYVCKKAEEK